MDSNQTNNGITLDFDDDITITLGDMTGSTTSPGLYTWDSGYGTISQSNIGPITISSNWNNTSPSWTFTDSDLVSPNSGKISLKGDDADIDVNGVSLMDTLKTIQDRLNMLRPDPEMEQEWDELRELREQYESKLAECREKSQMWNTLKKMPPPDIK